jgi:hypothetical protein
MNECNGGQDKHAGRYRRVLLIRITRQSAPHGHSRGLVIDAD